MSIDASAVAPAPENGLATTIQQSLLVESPDMDALSAEVMTRLALTPDASRGLIYRVVAEANAAMFPPVSKLELILTEGCNLGCAYCFEAEMLGPRRMSLDTARAGIDLLFDYARDEPEVTITHFGGEPTLNLPAIRFATEYAEQKAEQSGKTVNFHMTSNGVRINAPMAEYFAQHDIKVLLSVDGLAETHDRHRRDKRGNGTFAQVVDAIKLLKRTQPWIGVKMTVMPDTASMLFDNVVGLHALGVNQFLISYATGVAWSDEDMQVYAAEFGKVYAWYKREKTSGQLRISELDQIEETAPGYFGCQAGRNSMTVTVDGEVSPCAKVLALDNKKLLAKLGDVRFGLTHLLNRVELVSARRVQAACRTAGIADDYEGGCFAQNHEDNGSLFAPSLDGYKLNLLQRGACNGCSGSCS
ncbi:radical SAM protein [Kitasatospora sp. NPDC097643]|uniref:radical SAM protein n=1 Tax=Kitasatospora sp. NPDC097643 TaxID=3157230 RepID=UPI00331E2967